MFEELAAYEAAIRADEREKCAREVEAIGRNEWRNDVVPASVLAARLRAAPPSESPKACPTCEAYREVIEREQIAGLFNQILKPRGSGIDGGTACE